MSAARRLGRKGRADVRLDRDDGSIIWLSAYEVRLAYRALYAERVRAPAKFRVPSAADLAPVHPVTAEGSD